MARLLATFALGVFVALVSPVGAEWQSIGPGGGGWLWSLAVAPDEAGTVYVGCDVGGVYRSSDHGKSWRMLNRGLGNRYVQAFAIDPAHPSVVYAGTRGGVYKSLDRGEHWTMKRNGFPKIETWGISAPVAAVALDPGDSAHVLAGIGEPRTGRMKEGRLGGIYVSRDGADKWQLIAGPEELRQAQVYSIVFAADAPRTVLAATSSGVFRSADGGTTWARSSDGLPVRRALEIAGDGERAGTFYVTFSDAAAKTGGVAKSTNYGRSWEVVKSASRRGWEYWRIVADSQHADTVYAAERGGAGIFKTTDGGATWARITRDDNVRSAWFGRGLNATALAIDPRDPRRLYYANDMDIYGTADAGETWEQIATDLVRAASPAEPALWRGRGIETTCSSSVAVAPGCPNLVYLGYWDTGLWRSTDGGRTLSWATQWMGYGKAAAIVADPTRPWRAWLSYGGNRGPHRIWRTDDYGRDWRLVGYEDTGLPTGAIFGLTLDPGSPAERRTLYAPVVGQGLYRSEDGGETWARLGRGPGGNLQFTNLALDPSNPNRVFLGLRYGRKDGKLLPGGVWRSENAGRSWKRVGDIPERPRVVIAPSEPRVVYVAERDYSSVGRGGVYRSTNGGDTWELRAEKLDEGWGNIQRTYIGALAVDRRDAKVVYATSVDENYDLNCGKGVFVSRDGGKTWRSRNEGLTHFNVHNLLIDPNDPERLYAGTGGNGFFRWGPAPEAKPLPPAPASALPPDPACTTVQGWRCTAEKRHELTVHDDGFWWGRGYVLARMDTAGHGCRLIKTFARPLDISRSKIVSLRIRGVRADGTPLCISRMMMYEDQGRRLLYERDINLPTTWSLVELPLRDWAGEHFDKARVRRYEFEFWAPYPQARPYELAVGALRFRQ